MPTSRYQRGKKNVKGKTKIPWKNPFQGGNAFASAKISIKRRGIHVGFIFRF